MRLAFRKKIIILAVLSAALPLVLMLGLLFDLEKGLVSRAGGRMDVLLMRNLEQLSLDLYGFCTMTDDMFAEQVTRNVKAAQEILHKNGGASLASNQVQWAALPKDITLPALQIGEHVFAPDDNLQEVVPVVDEVKRLTDMDCTLFQRMNEEGDMLRVASTLEHPEHPDRRASGTIYRAYKADGTLNETTRTILKGEAHNGMDVVLGTTYLASRFPVTNADGTIIGMLGIGRRVDAMDWLKKIIEEMRVGKEGYAWVIEAGGPNRGTLLVGEVPEQTGADLWDAVDANNDYFVQEMVRDAHEAGAGVARSRELRLFDESGRPSEPELVSYVWFKPWNWLIGTSSPREGALSLMQELQEETRDSLVHMVFAGILLLVVTVVLAVVLGSHIVRPLARIQQVAGLIADGNIYEAREDLREDLAAGPPIAGDEISELNGSFMRMAESLGALLGQVQSSGIQVTSSTAEIASAARSLESTAVEQAATTRQITATTQQIRQTSSSLVDTMSGVGGAVDQAAAMAGSGQEKLVQMQRVMDDLVVATESISTKLAVINEKTGRITHVITTINAISDQTNLLSLNAAIEAEKAGEHGRGFAVVAREITRLADQTATATGDIEYVVREMQTSVSSGVMEMDNFGERVRSGVREASSISDHLEDIIVQVRSLGPMFDSVRTGVSEQGEGAIRISETMLELAQAADYSRDALHDFQHVTEQLNQAVSGLQQEVQRFRVSS